MIGNLDLLGGKRTLINDADGVATTYLFEPFDISGAVSGDLRLLVDATFGTTPKLDVTIQHSMDLSNWETLTTFTQATGATTENKALTGMCQYVRASVQMDGGDAIAVCSLMGSTRAS